MLTAEEVKERAEHAQMLQDINFLLGYPAGKNFFQYLFKHFEVAEVPDEGLAVGYLREKLALSRAGNSIFALVSEANPEVAGALLAKKEKERCEKLYQEYVARREEG